MKFLLIAIILSACAANPSQYSVSAAMQSYSTIRNDDDAPIANAVCEAILFWSAIITAQPSDIYESCDGVRKHLP